MKHKLYQGDTLSVLGCLPDNSFNCIITSPPYWGLRDYGMKGQIGLEENLEKYIERMLLVTKELKRVLNKDGVMFWNHGDCYGGWKRGNTHYLNRSGHSDKHFKRLPRKKFKSLMLQQYRLLIDMVDGQGWIPRNIIIWNKTNHLPGPWRDRFTNSYEPVFMLTKSKQYYFNLDAVRVPHKQASIERAERNRKSYVNGSRDPYNEQSIRINAKKDCHPRGKNPGDVWDISAGQPHNKHPARFPLKLVEIMLKAACLPAGNVLDPFMGSGTVMETSEKLHINSTGIELSPGNIEINRKRILPYLTQPNTTLEIVAPDPHHKIKMFDESGNNIIKLLKNWLEKL